jgi:polysaccharide biosynthesis transport protein
MHKARTAHNEITFIRDLLEAEVVDEVVDEVMSLSDSDVEEALFVRGFNPRAIARHGTDVNGTPAEQNHALIATRASPRSSWRKFTAVMLAPFARLIMRQAGVIALSAASVICVGAIYLVFTPPMFTSFASLLVDTSTLDGGQPHFNAHYFEMSSSSAKRAIEILKSEPIRLAAIKRLHPTDDTWFATSKLRFALLAFSSGPSTRLSSRDMLEVLKKNLEVKQGPLMNVVEVGFHAGSAQLAAEVANAVADAYVSGQANERYRAAERSRVWLELRVFNLSDRMKKSELAIKDLMAVQNGAFRDIDGHKLAELNSSIILARAAAAEARARLDRITEIVRSGDIDVIGDSGNATQSLPDTVSRLRSQYRELARREADWAARYGDNHVAVVNLRSLMREIHTSISDELQRIAQTYRSDYEVAKQHERNISDRLTELILERESTEKMTFAVLQLEDTLRTNRDLYDRLLARYGELVWRATPFEVSQARVIIRASPLLSKPHPDALLILAAVTTGGMLLGLILGMWRERRRPAYAGPRTSSMEGTKSYRYH